MIPVSTILAGSLADLEAPATAAPGRRLVLGVLVVALSLVWAPSALDQLGHLGFTAPPTYEGFAPVCPG